jgi:hypothetical protein
LPSKLFAISSRLKINCRCLADVLL